MMTSNKKRELAKWIVGILLVIGICGYGFTAYKNKANKNTTHEPIRVMYQPATGKVLFDHKTHASETKYGLSCIDCHHHPEEEEDAIRSCDFCHVYPDKDKSFNPNCLECHDQEDVEGVETNYLVDKNHTRGECIKCHTDFGKGPVECLSCHGKY